MPLAGSGAARRTSLPLQLCSREWRNSRIHPQIASPTAATLAASAMRAHMIVRTTGQPGSGTAWPGTASPPARRCPPPRTGPAPVARRRDCSAPGPRRTGRRPPGRSLPHPAGQRPPPHTGARLVRRSQAEPSTARRRIGGSCYWCCLSRRPYSSALSACGIRAEDSMRGRYSRIMWGRPGRTRSR